MTHPSGVGKIPFNSIDPIAWIELVIRRYGGSNVGNVCHTMPITFIIEQLKFIVVRVAEELGCDSCLIPRNIQFCESFESSTGWNTQTAM